MGTLNQTHSLLYIVRLFYPSYVQAQQFSINETFKLHRVVFE